MKRINQIMRKMVCVVLMLTIVFSAMTYTVFAASPASQIEARLNQISALQNYAPGKRNPANYCWKFVNAVSQQLFGVQIPLGPKGYKLTGASNYWYLVNGVYDANATDANVINLLKTAQAGDIIQYTSSGATWQHTAMVYSTNANSITIYDSSKPFEDAGYQTVRKYTCSWNTILTNGWSSGMGRFGGINGYGLSLYRCNKNVLTSNLTGNVVSSGTTSATASAITTGADTITQTSAILRGSVSSSEAKMTQCGMLIGTSTENMTRLGYDSINTYSTTCFYSTSKYGQTLTPGTTYYYQVYAIADGKEYKGNIRSFTTLLCTNHVKGQYLWYAEEHPHYDHYTCAVCGQTFRDTTTNNMPSCKICNPDPQPCNHVKGKYLWYAEVHPHYDHYICAVCGEQFRDTTTHNVSSCKICNPDPQPCNHVKGEYLWYAAEHPHYDHYACAICGQTYRSTITNNMPSCEICNPQATVTVTTEPARQITSTSAQLVGSLSVSNVARATITEDGIYLGTSPSVMTLLTKSTSSCTVTGLWSFVDTDDYITLKPNTTYYYYYYVVVDGKTIKGSAVSFKTLP